MVAGRLGLALFDLLEPWLEVVLWPWTTHWPASAVRKMFGMGMHHDPLLSSRGKAVMNWGHSWVVLGVLVRFPLWPDRVFCLPMLFRLYLNEAKAPSIASDTARGRNWRSKCFTTVQTPKNAVFSRGCRQRYGGKSVLCHLPANCDLTSRLLIDARLYEAPASAKDGQQGPASQTWPAVAFARADADRPLPSRLAPEIYGRSEEAGSRCDVEARVHAVPERPLRVVAVEALRGGRGQEVFYSTCHTASAETVIAWYAMRWSLEVAFHDSKQHLGFEQPQGWTRRAVQRTAPVAMLLYSLIVFWFVRQGHRHYRPDECPWYRRKSRASFLDMLTTLRRESVRNQFLSLGLSGEGSRKALQAIENAVSLAM